MNTRVMFSSEKEDWETPKGFFEALDAEFGFTVDVCADAENRKCERYFTKETDGLKQNWGGETAWCNPPYGKEIAKWVKKASEEAKKENTKVVMLLPARTDTKWFHGYIYEKENVQVRFVKGRLKFGGGKNSAPFPSMVIVFG